MRFLITEKLGPHKFKTPEGYLICTDAILSRTGKQEYKRCELFGDACEDPDKIVNVDRTDAEVFDDKAMASFENKPICIEHPDEDVNVENHNDLSVGFVRDIHKGEDNGHPVMMGTLVITDKNAVEAVESGEYKELSCGYDCDIDDDAELCQRNIRGNHVALCKQGRAGIARIVDSVKDVNDLTKFKMALRNISKMYSNDPGIEYVTSVLRNLGYEVTVDSIDGWRENKNVPGEHIKKYRMNVMLEGREHHFLVQLYADMGEWKVKEINAYMLDSINTNQGEYMKDEDFSKKTKQGYQVLEMYRDGGRLHIIFKRANDFGIGLGYDTTDGQWSQGRYDFSTLEKARQALMEEKPYARRIQDSVNDDNWSSVEEENYNKANKPVGAKDETEKNFKIYVKNAFGAYKVADWPAVSKEAAVKEFLEMNPAYRNKGIIEARDSVSDSKKEQLFTVEYEQNGVMHVHKVRASSIEDAISKVKDAEIDKLIEKYTDDPNQFGDSCIYDTGKWYRVAYYTIVGNSTNNYELFVRAEGYSDAKAKAAKAAKRIHGSKKICPTFDMHVSEVSEQEAKRQNPSIVFDSEVNFSDSAQTQDSKERLFTIEYKQDDVMYIRKVRANSIEDAISKVKDDAHKVVVFTNQVLNELGKNNSIGKYDRVVQAMRSLYSESLLPDDKLKELIRKKVPEYIKKYVKE